MAAALTYAQLKGLWLDASKGTKYHTNRWASLMAAIAMAESGGRPDALNPSDNGGTQSSFGLWQISNGTHTPPTANWSDPRANAQLAIGKLNSQGLGAWGTYTSGAYKQFLSGKTAAAPPPAGTGGPSTTAAQPVTQQQCVIWFPGVLGAGSTCLFSKGNARAMIGGILFGGGSLVAFVGVSILVAKGFQKSGALNAVINIAELAPGTKGAAAGLRKAKAAAT